MPDKSELLLGCAPITEKPGIDRAMRAAVNRARHGKKAATFRQQQAFDAAIAKLVRAIPVDEQIAEWFWNEMLTGLRAAEVATMTRLSIGIEEAPGQIGWYAADPI